MPHFRRRGYRSSHSERYLFHDCYWTEWISRSNPQRFANRGARCRRPVAWYWRNRRCVWLVDYRHSTCPSGGSWKAGCSRNSFRRSERSWLASWKSKCTKILIYRYKPIPFDLRTGTYDSCLLGSDLSSQENSAYCGCGRSFFCSFQHRGCGLPICKLYDRWLGHTRYTRGYYELAGGGIHHRQNG